MSRPLVAEYARHGWALVPIPSDQKGPVAAGWNLRERAITDPDIAEHMDGNVGLAHAYSGTCCVDLDDMELATGFLAERGVDIATLLAAPDAVMISSGRPNRAKLLYRTPKPLPSFKLQGFELRCATSKGTTVQDVLPPSVHPDTGKPYEWKYGDELGHWSVLPELPAEVRKLWQSLITPETKIQPERAERDPTTRDPNARWIREQLARRNPACGYDEWIKVGMGLHDEFNGAIEGLALWDEWSSKSPTNYKGRADLETHWRSFKKGSGRTIASLRVDEAASADEFEVVTEEQVEAAQVEAKKPTVPSTVREAINTLRRDNNGRPLAVLPNVMTILGLPTITGNILAYDAFKDELVCAPSGTDEWRTIKDTDYTAIRLWLETNANFFPVSRELVRDSVHYLAEANQMDSAQTWLTGLKWDGKPRIAKFMPTYMGTIDAEYETAVGLYLWTALAGRVMEPGCQVDMVPILVGAQGVGKTQGVKALAPSKDTYCEIKLGEKEDDIARKLRGSLVGELAELKGLRTSDLESIKAFITRTHEKWTPKFKEFATTFPRRVVMIGTTNEDDFLLDEENRRWLPVRTAGIDVEAIKRDRDQLWAEALQLWMQHGVKWKTAEKLARGQHEEFKVADQWEPIVQQWLSENPEADKLQIGDVLVQAVGLDIRTVTRVHELRVAKILRAAGFTKKVLRVNGKSAKVWARIAAPATTEDPAT